MGRLFTSLLAFVLLAVCGGLLASALFLPGAAAMANSVKTSEDVFNKLPVALQEEPLAKISTFKYANGKVMARFYEQNRIEVPYSKISPNMVNAQIAIEDERFYDHHGVDIQGIVRAAIKNSSSDGEVQAGGSTITQQYVKNMLIQNAVAANDSKAVREATESTLGRKIREARLALAVEKKYTKEQIVTKYLNIAQFGKSSYGVEAASRHFFSKPASKLSIAESALLAGMVQSPNTLDPTVNPDKSQERRNLVLDNMYKIGAITADQRDRAKAIKVTDMLKVSDTTVGCQTAGIDAYFCDYAVHTILNDPMFGKTEEDRRNLLYRGGITFTTTLEHKTNQEAYDALTRKIPLKDKVGVRNGLAAVEPGTGKIRAMAQNTQYTLNPKPKYYQTTVNYTSDIKYGGSRGFQPGSSFKPITLAEWLRTGHGLGQTIPVKTSFGGGWNAHCLENPFFGPWSPRGKGGSSSVLSGITHSSNTVLATMESKLDLCDVADMAHNLGIQRADGDDWSITPAQVLGSNEVSPLSMAAAYATFASRGTYCKPTPFESAKDSNGKPVELPVGQCRKALSQDVADGVNYALQTVITSGTAAGQGIGRPSAGKTGTTDQARHVWFVGYTPQLATAVWAGNPKVNHPIQGGYAQGATMSTPVWHNFMMAAMEGLPVQSFTAPPTSIRYGPRATVPSVVGMSPEDAQKALEAAGFTATLSKSPQYDPVVPSGYVATQDPGGNSNAYQGSPVELTVSQGPDPQDQSGLSPVNPGDTGQDAAVGGRAQRDSGGNDDGGQVRGQANGKKKNGN